MRALAAIALTVFAAGCAKNADQIGATYVSPNLYQSLSCEQIAAESMRVSARASELTGVQNKQAKKDALTMGVGLVIFWPAVFFTKGDGQQTAELARIKGEAEALQQASIQKNCGIEYNAG